MEALRHVQGHAACRGWAGIILLPSIAAGDGGRNELGGREEQERRRERETNIPVFTSAQLFYSGKVLNVFLCQQWVLEGNQ